MKKGDCFILALSALSFVVCALGIANAGLTLFWGIQLALHTVLAGINGRRIYLNHKLEKQLK